jgi:hypothetical protein
MIPSDHLRSILLYFARFVGKDYVALNFKEPEYSRLVGYDELVADLQALPQDRVIADLKTFVFSINKQLVFDATKAGEDMVLFVEYGAMDLKYNPRMSDLDTTLSITVLSDFNKCNSDGIQEFCLSNRIFTIVNQILDALQSDSESLDWCDGKLINGQVDFTPVPPETFEGKGGWNAILKQFKNVG